jgi:hypothetical protein
MRFAEFLETAGVLGACIAMLLGKTDMATSLLLIAVYVAVKEGSKR